MRNKKGARWTESELGVLLAVFHAGGSDKVIARAVGRPYESVKTQRARLAALGYHMVRGALSLRGPRLRGRHNLKG